MTKRSRSDAHILQVRETGLAPERSIVSERRHSKDKKRLLSTFNKKPVINPVYYYVFFKKIDGKSANNFVL